MADIESLKNMMGHSSEEFTQLTLLSNDFGLIAQYIDEQLDEEDLFSLTKSKAIIYGIVALNWHLAYKSHGYEAFYVALVNAQPIIQEEFDSVRESLSILITNSN